MNETAHQVKFFFNVRTYECRANYMNEIILLQSDSFTGMNNKRKNSFAPDVWLRSSVGRPSRYLNWTRMGLGSNGTGFEFCRSLSLFFPDCFSAISYITPYLRSYHYLFTIRRSKITCFIKLRSTNHFTGMKKPLKFASIPTFGFVALLLLALLSRFFFQVFFFFSNFFNCFSLATGWHWMILFHLHRYLQTLLYLFLQMTAMIWLVLVVLGGLLEFQVPL